MAMPVPWVMAAPTPCKARAGKITSKDGANPDKTVAEDISRYLETDTSSAKDRVQLFRLAWDVSCSAFGARQILYERFFQADSVRNAVILYNMTDREPASNLVREFLAQD